MRLDFMQYVISIVFFPDKKNVTGPKSYCDQFNLPVDFTKFYIDHYQPGNNEYILSRVREC